MGSGKEKCKDGCVWVWSSLFTTVFEYDTAKIVHIKNKKVGLINRLVQLTIIGYIIGYGIIYDKGYQKSGSVSGTVTTKMKGAYLFNNSDEFMDGCEDYFNLSSFSVYDPADYVIPPQEPDSFFIMTNMWVTCGQTYRECPESPDVGFSCESDSDCVAGHIQEAGNGPNTGVCNDTTHTCVIRAWCPTEDENDNITKSEARINASAFTVLIKNSIRYPGLLPDERKRNILSVEPDDNYLRNCTFSTHPKHRLYCPIMPLGYIVDKIHGGNFTDLSIRGGVVGIEIAWNCDLDWKLEKCDPKYSFRRLDDPNVGISRGFNFRFARYYQNAGVETRTLFKAYGILFKVVTTGRGGKFDFTTLVLKIGSMIALLGIAVVVSDVIVLYLLKKGGFYRRNKYQQVNDSEGEDGYEIITNPPATQDPENQPIQVTVRSFPLQKRVNYSSSSDDSPHASDKF